MLGSGRWNSQLLVISTQANTAMNITFTQDVRLRIGNVDVDVVAGTEYSYSIDRLECFYAWDVDDLIGTKVLTDKPIWLFSGHACAVLPSIAGNCDHLV